MKVSWIEKEESTGIKQTGSPFFLGDLFFILNLFLNTTKIKPSETELKRSKLT